MNKATHSTQELIAISLEVLLTNQHPSGSFPASPNFPPFQYCFIRDASFSAYALLKYNYTQEAKRFLIWCKNAVLSCEGNVDLVEKKWPGSDSVNYNELLPARFELDGRRENNDWPNFQIDCYGTWLWLLAEYVHHTGDQAILASMNEAVYLTVRYLEMVWTWACFDPWEEHNHERHTSSLACVYGGLSKIGTLLQDETILALAGRVKKHIENAITEEGIFPKFLSGGSIDASSLWLNIPYEVIPISDSVFRKTVQRIETELRLENGVYRYPHDTYYGGGRWPLLSCWLAIYKLRIGEIEDAKSLIHWIESLTDSAGFFPEHCTDHPIYLEEKQKWLLKWGENTAPPLLWTHAMYLLFQFELKNSSLP